MTLVFFSKGAIDRFAPEDRDCYTAEEVNLVSLPLKKGYREQKPFKELTSCLSTCFQKIIIIISFFHGTKAPK